MTAEPKNFFSLQDIILLLNGCKLYKSNILIKFINNIIFLLTFSYNVMHFTLYCRKFLKKAHFGPILWCIQVSVSILTQIKIRGSSDGIRSLLHEISFASTNTNNFLKVSRIGFVIWLIGFMTHALVNLNEVNNDDVEEYMDFHYAKTEIVWLDHILASVDTLLFSNCIIGFIIGSQFVYTSILLFIKSVYVIRIRTFRGSMKDGWFGLDSNDVKSFRTFRQQIHDLRDKFEAIFSFLPFLWFSQMFLETATRLLKLMEKESEGESDDEKSLKHILIEFGEYIILCLSLMMTSFICDGLVREQRDEEKMLKSSLIVSQDPKDLNMKIEKMRLLMEMDIMNPIEYPSAWDLFHIQKGSILSFLGHVIPFAVMFLSLSQNELSSATSGAAATN